MSPLMEIAMVFDPKQQQILKFDSKSPISNSIQITHQISGTVNFNFRNRPSLIFTETWCLLSRQHKTIFRLTVGL